MNRDDKHIFAVYVAKLFENQQIYPDCHIPITDEDVLHRVLTVLRLGIGEELILFDTQKNFRTIISDIKKHKILTVTIRDIQVNARPRLGIEFILPLLKREALEEVVYSLSEIGVTDITLIVTDKSQRNLGPKELQRLHKIQVAAAEQSKNFYIPRIHAPVSFELWCNGAKQTVVPSILFDPQGKAALEVLGSMSGQNNSKIRALIGPEGGLTQDEIQVVKELGFVRCRLTATVLRAVQAASVGAGMIASLL